MRVWVRQKLFVCCFINNRCIALTRNLCARGNQRRLCRIRGHQDSPPINIAAPENQKEIKRTQKYRTFLKTNVNRNSCVAYIHCNDYQRLRCICKSGRTVLRDGMFFWSGSSAASYFKLFDETSLQKNTQR